MKTKNIGNLQKDTMADEKIILDYKDDYVEKGDDESEVIGGSEILKYKFSTMGGDFAVRMMVDQINDGDIEIPTIQRNYVWTPLMASRFIESMLLDLPIPSIFLAKKANGKFLIVDGLQRLTTLYYYITMKPLGDKIFKISTSDKILNEWRGKSFSELDISDQRKLKNKTMHAIIIEQKAPENLDGLYLIFERINTGGVQLNQQEIRNAIYQCPLNDKLHEINENVSWRTLYGNNEIDKRKRDIEMILRFFALESNLETTIGAKGSVNFINILNKYMDKNQKITASALDELSKKFINLVTVINEIYGNTVFRSIDGKSKNSTKKFLATVYDAVMISTQIAINEGVDFVNSNPEKLTNLLEREDFKVMINSHTADKTSVYGRIKLACEILYGLNYEESIHR